VTINLPVFLYGCKTWSVILRPRVFENKALRKTCGPERGEVTGDWRRLYNEELHDF
jgi:hypothetical protein